MRRRSELDSLSLEPMNDPTPAIAAAFANDFQDYRDRIHRLSAAVPERAGARMREARPRPAALVGMAVARYRRGGCTHRGRALPVARWRRCGTDAVAVARDFSVRAVRGLAAPSGQPRRVRPHRL